MQCIAIGPSSTAAVRNTCLQRMSLPTEADEAGEALNSYVLVRFDIRTPHLVPKPKHHARAHVKCVAGALEVSGTATRNQVPGGRGTMDLCAPRCVARFGDPLNAHTHTLPCSSHVAAVRVKQLTSASVLHQMKPLRPQVTLLHTT